MPLLAPSLRGKAAHSFEKKKWRFFSKRVITRANEYVCIMHIRMPLLEPPLRGKNAKSKGGGKGSFVLNERYMNEYAYMYIYMYHRMSIHIYTHTNMYVI